MSFMKQEQTVEWWKSPDLADLTILRFDEDPRIRRVYEAVAWGKTLHPDFGFDDGGGLVFAKDAIVVVNLSRNERIPSVRHGKEIGGLVPVTIWALLGNNRESRELAKRVRVVFEKLGMKDHDAWMQEVR